MQKRSDKHMHNNYLNAGPRRPLNPLSPEKPFKPEVIF